MKVHHFDCGRTCPCGLGLLGKAFALGEPPTFVTRVTLLETTEGPVLIDAGYPRHFLASPERHPVRWAALRPQAGEEQSASERLKAAGIAPRDVRHILLTHLDFDHVGGVVDFPQATLHVLDAEVAAARAPRLGFERFRYREVESVLAGRRIVTVRAFAHPWCGTVSAAPLAPLASMLRFVPLPGHARGHAGIAYLEGAQEAPRGESPAGPRAHPVSAEGAPARAWTLHAGDAFFDTRELDAVGDAGASRAPQGFEDFAGDTAFKLLARATSFLHADARVATQTLRLLRRLRAEGMRIECSHDAKGFPTPTVAQPPSAMERIQA